VGKKRGVWALVQAITAINPPTASYERQNYCAVVVRSCGLFLFRPLIGCSCVRVRFMISAKVRAKF